MPTGMFLKSQGFASNLSDPDGTHTLAAFCAATGRPYADYGLPVPLDTFIAYGQWFTLAARGRCGGDPGHPDHRRAGLLRADPGHRGAARARRVVIAAGIEHFARLAVS